MAPTHFEGSDDVKQTDLHSARPGGSRVAFNPWRTPGNFLQICSLGAHTQSETHTHTEEKPTQRAQPDPQAVFLFFLHFSYFFFWLRSVLKSAP